ncbi:hypothetical protein B0H67DRAFT_119058 [Lasiosphaeris hirsuta]|uniref:Uncharacterized protein n=1 Tax=Lasiosphaeris hirsuta TaxID=260670 RepID=A0AA40AZP7_9PEZI|nr:hypothetical protein B0H67DRAFT_119058 [Lasiosphaeris hirsuta]
MTTIPGAYPVDLATPDEPTPLSHSHSHSHHHNHQHHDRNKLHKPIDPRGHKHADSGVGLFDSVPIQSSKVPEPKPGIFQDIDTNERIHEGPSYSFDSEPNRTIRYDSEPAAVPPQASEANRAAPQDVDGANSHHSESNEQPIEQKVEDKTTSDKTAGGKPKTDEIAPPYWGSLPKALGGGIYNTVMGHGSSTDDHAQHHNIPQRSEASERSHVPGDTTDYPRGGIYNSVAGHGSKDEESKRHDLPHASEAQANMHPSPGAAMLNIVEQNESSPSIAEAGSGKSDVAPTVLPETSMRDDVLLAGNVSGYDDRHTDPRPETSAPETTQTSRKSESAAPRAFPLTASHQEDQHHSSWSGSRTEGDLAGAANVGAGIAAAKQAEKPKKLKKQKEPSPNGRDRRRSKEVTRNNNDGLISGNHPQRQKEENELTQTERKKSRDEGSPTGEKKHHKILGIFHRHKDDDTAVSEPTKQETNHRSSHKKQEAAAAATAGAGAYGLMHHREDDKKVKEKESISELASQQPNFRGRSKSVKEIVTAPAAESAGGFGTLYQKPEEQPANLTFQDSLGNKPTQPPPERSNKRHSHSLVPSEASAGDFSQPAATSNVTQNHSQPSGADKSKVDPAVASGIGLAVGLGAYQLAGTREQSKLPDLEPLDTTSDFENPREPPSANLSATSSTKPSTRRSLRASSLSNPSAIPAPTGHSSGDDAAYGTGRYSAQDFGAAANVKPISHMNTPSAAQRATRQSTDYNVLSSGTTAGGKSSSFSGSTTKIGNGGAVMSSRQDDDSELYNVLSSGTPSGVKVKPRTPRSSVSADPNRGGDGQFNTLSSSSGVDAVNRQKSSERAKGESTKHTLSPPPIPAYIEERKHDVAHEAKPELHMFPTPEQAQDMSPEVLPAPYTAAAPRSSPSPKIRDTEISSPVLTKEGSLPIQHQDVERKRSHPSTTDPALAAATGAWTANGGAVGGNAGPEKLVHKCEHCGGDNDISTYLRRMR